QDRHVGGAAAGRGHRELGVVRRAPGKRHRLEVHLGPPLLVGALHLDHPLTVAAGEQVPVPQRLAAPKRRTTAAGEAARRDGAGGERRGSEEAPSADRPWRRAGAPLWWLVQR